MALTVEALKRILNQIPKECDDNMIQIDCDCSDSYKNIDCLSVTYREDDNFSVIMEIENNE